jgi:DNA mismatch repair ATPase MutS
MSFTADKQTLDDLNLTGRYRPQSIYSFFNKVQTAGGEKLLDDMFRHPLSDDREINRRSMTFQYFGHKALTFPFDGDKVAMIEDYLGAGDAGNRVSATMGVVRKRVAAMLLRDDGYRLVQLGIAAVCEVCTALARLLDELEDDISPYADECVRLRVILSDSRLRNLHGKKLSLFRLAELNHLFNHVLPGQLREMLDALYRLDVYTAVSGIAEAHGFGYAAAMPAETHLLDIVALRHPVIEKGVPNSVALHRAGSNMLFLTGANMAGKSTFMKAFGIAIYLAHMGFPVAAKEMTFSVMDGICCSINIADNLAMGYSHFYAEVLRVKNVAEVVGEGRNLVVLFDELFKGTNVRDAYDATLAVTEAFAAFTSCWFIISTHIIEVGEVLRERCGNMQFRYLPTIMEGGRPRYTYQMEEGITADRHGMLIIRNEGILEIIKSS